MPHLAHAEEKLAFSLHPQLPQAKEHDQAAREAHAAGVPSRTQSSKGELFVDRGHFLATLHDTLRLPDARGDRHAHVRNLPS